MSEDNENQNQSVLPAPGSYKARRTGAITTKETDAGALCCYVPYELLGSAVAYCGVHTLTLGKQDGTLQKSSWENLAKAFPEWQPREDGQLNPYDLKNIPMTPEGTPEFMAKDCFHDEYNGKLSFKIQWFNALGSGKDSTPEEQAATESKWGEKFKIGASLVRGAAAPKPEEKPAPVAEVKAPSEPAAKKPAARKTATKTPAKVWTTAEEVYAALLKNSGVEGDAKKEEEVTDKVWYPACDAVCGDNNPPTTAEHFAAVAEKLGL